MAAALLLGADGVNVGTRFMLTEESPVHTNIKQVLLASDELRTTLIKRTLKRTGRYFANAVAREIVALERRPGGATFADLQHLLSGARGQAAMAAGDVDGGLICASQVIGLVDDIPTCAELISRMVAECRASLEGALAALAG